MYLLLLLYYVFKDFISWWEMSTYYLFLPFFGDVISECK